MLSCLKFLILFSFLCLFVIDLFVFIYFYSYCSFLSYTGCSFLFWMFFFKLLFLFNLFLFIRELFQVYKWLKFVIIHFSFLFFSLYLLYYFSTSFRLMGVVCSIYAFCSVDIFVVIFEMFIFLLIIVCFCDGNVCFYFFFYSCCFFLIYYIFQSFRVYLGLVLSSLWL